MSGRNGHVSSRTFCNGVTIFVVAFVTGMYESATPVTKETESGNTYLAREVEGAISL